MRQKGSGKKCVMFIANRGYALTSSRLPLIQHFITNNWKVIAITANDNESRKLSDLGVIIEPVIFNRGGLTVTKDLNAFLSLYRIFRRHQPKIVHLFHAKPIILGGLVSRFFPDVKMVSTVTGLGHAFVNGGLSRYLASMGYKYFLRTQSAVIFQNPDDQKLFLDHRWVANDQSKLIIGSGVDTQRFQPITIDNIKQKPVRIFMAARLIKEKGIKEFVEAAKIVKKDYPNTSFCLAGEWDFNHPSCVDKSWLEKEHNEGNVNFLGYVEDIENELQQCDICVLPSYYREGVPRILLEAAASGRPIVTTDMPGCRESVIDQVTGLLIPPRNSHALANAVIKLVENETLRINMGNAGRKRIEEEFDINIIIKKQLEVYREIGINI